jgi:hypothetical protein
MSSGKLLLVEATGARALPRLDAERLDLAAARAFTNDDFLTTAFVTADFFPFFVRLTTGGDVDFFAFFNFREPTWCFRLVLFCLFSFFAEGEVEERREEREGDVLAWALALVGEVRASCAAATVFAAGAMPPRVGESILFSPAFVSLEKADLARASEANQNKMSNVCA